MSSLTLLSPFRSLDMLSRLKGIETLFLTLMVWGFSSPLDMLSRLKGMETAITYGGIEVFLSSL